MEGRAIIYATENFTLPGLLTVIAIITIPAGMLLPEPSNIANTSGKYPHNEKSRYFFIKKGK